MDDTYAPVCTRTIRYLTMPDAEWALLSAPGRRRLPHDFGTGAAPGKIVAS